MRGEGVGPGGPGGSPPDVLEIRPFELGDLPGARSLWALSEGLGVGPGDSEPAMARFLARNQGLSLVAVERGLVVGAILCGHDGRRGYIYRLAVARAHRRRGLAEDLVRRCLGRLKAEGLPRCLALVEADNEGGRAFWTALGCRFRSDLVTFSIDP